tara:strand:+ start:46 stop:891 length:846 start_codon:yes stop_codon:yes gene_type:complete
VNKLFKIDFKGEQINFWQASEFSKRNSIPHNIVLKQAYDQGVLIDKKKNILLDFINYIEENEINLKSQLYQDLFASFVIKNNFKKTFLEFGATNGIDLSNTYKLENELSWTGVLAEPDTNWISTLKKNRHKSKIITKCIWSKSGEKVNFFSSSESIFSTIEKFKHSDFKSMPGNTALRTRNGKNIVVETISLNQLIEEEFKGEAPSYISIDTEGSEFEILNSFDFSKYQPPVFTIEHNFTDFQKKIDILMFKNGYCRVFDNLTAFDAWYISKKAQDNIKNF